MSDEQNTAPTSEETAPAADATPASDAAAVAEPAKDQKKSDDKQNDGGRPRNRRGNRPPRKKEPKEFEETILGIDRVTRVTAGGRQMRFRVTVAIGDKKGRVGFGMGKSSEVMVGVQKAIAQAKKRLITVPIVNDTIPHPVNTKYKATKIFLIPAPEGKGVIAGGSVRKILELAGIKNVLSKLHGSRNKITSAYATIKALQMLRNQTPPGAKVEEAPKEEEPKAKTEKKEAKPKAEKKAPAKKAPAKKAAAKKPAAKKAAPKKDEK